MVLRKARKSLIVGIAFQPIHRVLNELPISIKGAITKEPSRKGREVTANLISNLIFNARSFRPRIITHFRFFSLEGAKMGQKCNWPRIISNKYLSWLVIVFVVVVGIVRRVEKQPSRR